jgi:acetyl-CoA acetyltransferase family protein
MKDDALYVVDGVRTPFSRMGTDLAGQAADELGRAAVNALLAKTGFDPEMVSEVIFGCVSQPAESMNLARVIALRAGLPEHVPAMTVHRNCASGFESLTTAHQRMMAGHGDVFIVGGAENMSLAPFYYRLSAVAKFSALATAKSFWGKVRGATAFRPADFSPVIGLKLGLNDPVSGLNMGETAEILARENGITREAQDAFALESHRRAAAAREKFAEEIWPVYDKGKAVVKDNGIREEQSMEALAKLRPVFETKTGTVTAGNSSQITDGAVALLAMSGAKVKALGLEPLGVLSGYAYTGCDPARMGLGPVSAIRVANEASGLKLADADVVEINEAFAAQVLAVVKHLGEQGTGSVPSEKLNVNGGAIALGHPVGATGARLVLTSLLELKRRGARRALVSLCVGGGQGGALWLERP